MFSWAQKYKIKSFSLYSQKTIFLGCYKLWPNLICRRVKEILQPPRKVDFLRVVMRTSLLRMHKMILRWTFEVQSQELAHDN